MRKWSALIFSALCLASGCTSGPEDGVVNQSATTVDENGEPTTRDSTFEADAGDYALNAERYYETGDYRRALSQFQKYKEKEPNSWGAALGIAYCRYQLGRQLVASGRFEDAHVQLSEAEVAFTERWNGGVEKKASDPAAYQWKACMGLGLTERAIANLDSIKLAAIESRLRNGVDGGTAEVADQRRRLQNHRKEYYRRALEKFEALAKMQDASPDAFLNLGDLYVITGADLSNESALGNGSGLNDVGPARRGNANRIKAERAYMTYLETAKRSVDNWEKMRRDAAERYPDRRSYEEAVALIEQKRSSATEKTVDVMIQVALIKYGSGDTQAALGYLRSAHELDPKRTWLHLNIAECYDRLADYDQALKHVDTYIAQSPAGDEGVRRAYKLRAEIAKKQTSR